MSQPSTRPLIMMVDDTAVNLELLKAILGPKKYHLRTFGNGPAILEAVTHEIPDLILLDIAMPEMDGYAVCERIKANPALADIPVIFISALTETSDKVRAFACGGVDYITKPLQPAEVNARVKSQLQLSQQQRRLAEKLEHIRRLEELRDNLTHMIAHDMRTPIGTIALALEILQRQLPGPDEKIRETMEILDANTGILTRMVDQMLDMSRLESGQMPLAQVRYDLVAQVQQVIATRGMLGGRGRVVLEPAEATEVFADRDIINRVIENLLENALKFSSSPQRVTIAVTRNEHGVRLSVSDQGEGIPLPDQGKIFDKYVQLGQRERRSGSGLGLAFCKLAVEAHGGSIGVAAGPGRGSTFWFELPAGKN